MISVLILDEINSQNAHSQKLLGDVLNWAPSVRSAAHTHALVVIGVANVMHAVGDKLLVESQLKSKLFIIKPALFPLHAADSTNANAAHKHYSHTHTLAANAMHAVGDKLLVESQLKSMSHAHSHAYITTRTHAHTWAISCSWRARLRVSNHAALSLRP